MSVPDGGEAGRRAVRPIARLEDLAGSLLLGALASSVVFDVASTRAADQFVYATGAAALQSIGLLAGVAAAVLGAAVAGALPRGSEAFGHRVRRLLVLDLVLVGFAALWFGRADAPLAPVAEWQIALSAVGVSVLGWLRWDGGGPIEPTAPPS